MFKNLLLWIFKAVKMQNDITFELTVIENGEKAKMNKMHRNDTSSIILPRRQTLPPLRQKNFAKANGDTEIIRNFAPDGHSVYGLWHVSVQRDKRYRSRLNFYEIQDLPLFLRRFCIR